MYSVSGIYSDTISNRVNCDSVITLDLTINTIDPFVTINSNTLTAYDTVATYQWVDCGFDYQILFGAAKQNFRVVKNGSYAVILNKGNCIDTSACNLVIVTEVDDFFGGKIIIYPNPSTDEFNVDLGRVPMDVKIEVFDLNSKLLLSKNFNMVKRFPIDLNQSQGVYFLRISTERESAMFKLIKE